MPPPFTTINWTMKSRLLSSVLLQRPCVNFLNNSSNAQLLSRRCLSTSAVEKEVFEKAIQKDNVVKCIERMRAFKVANPPKPGTVGCAAVFVPFCHDQDNHPAILFTRRSFRLKNHKGDVCFPGGFEEHDDDDVTHSAIRELSEEIGLPKEDLTVYGQLDPFAFRDFALHPVFGYLNLQSGNEMKINHDEVDSVHVISLDKLIDMDNWHKTRFTHGWTMPVFLDKDRQYPRIWGMTAVILYLTLINLMPKHFAFSTSYLARNRKPRVK